MVVLLRSAVGSISRVERRLNYGLVPGILRVFEGDGYWVNKGRRLNWLWLLFFFPERLSVPVLSLCFVVSTLERLVLGGGLCLGLEGLLTVGCNCGYYCQLIYCRV